MTIDASLHADLRAPSISQNRFHTSRAKYSPRPPTSTGHPYSLPVPGLAFDPTTGRFGPATSAAPLPKPQTALLTKTQRYLIAQNHVPEFVGKQVNRNNQRSGERDPWRWAGPGRRWQKGAMSGVGEARRGGDEWRRLRDCDMEEEVHQELLEEEMEMEYDEEQEEEMFGRERYGDSPWLSLRVTGHRRTRRRSIGEWKVVSLEDAAVRWTEDGQRNEAEEQHEEEGWDVVSVKSAPL